MASKPGSGTSGGMTSKQAARRVVRQVSRYATPKEGAGVVKAVSSKGGNPNYRRQVVQQVRAERGASAAQAVRRELRVIDRSTGAGKGAARVATRRAANRQVKKMK